MVTGVALASTLHHQYLFYFGCVFQAGSSSLSGTKGGASIGGAGLARVNQRDGSVVSVAPLRRAVSNDVGANAVNASRDVTASRLFLMTCSEKFSMAVAAGNVIGGQGSGGVVFAGQSQWLFWLLFGVGASAKICF